MASNTPHAESQRKLSEKAIRDRAEFLEYNCGRLVDESYHELRVELPRLQCFATQALDRATERFPGERKIAHVVLSTDIPKREKRIHAALLILEQAPYKERALYILGSPAKRSIMTADVIARGGLVDEFGKWRLL